MIGAGNSVTAIVNAGGRSQRMAASGVALHKALVPVLGVPLVERNLCVLLDQGIRDIAVVVNAQAHDVEEFVRARAPVLAAACGAVIDCIVEIEPLGNVGIARRIAPRADDLIVTFADNLTALDVRHVLARHRERLAALTIATHVEHLQAPYGELLIADDLVVDYLEKPTSDIRIASGIYAIRSDAASVIPAGRPTGAADLFRLLKDRGEVTAAFEHHADWVDVNDAPSIERADRLVSAHPDVFECRRVPPELTAVCIVVRAASHILVRNNAEDDFLGRFDVARVDAAGVTERALLGLISGAVNSREHLATLDDVSEGVGKVIRHELTLIEVDGADRRKTPEGYDWIPEDGDYETSALTQPLRRCLALLKRRP
ncbi:MAG TPA: sugar phosphate nucleotidyltransferase [Candidatus Eremiobacteraceae bacterium]|nr:sugar phosphate nucleotidyltransferase [Candidatus Eremiobacteraceae bacterium]